MTNVEWGDGVDYKLTCADGPLNKVFMLNERFQQNIPVIVEVLSRLTSRCQEEDNKKALLKLIKFLKKKLAKILCSSITKVSNEKG